MSAYQQLNQALVEREKRETKFYFALMDEIYQIIDDLQPCDSSNSTPEVSDSVNLSIQELESLIKRIKDDRNINKNVSDGIAQEFARKTIHLRREEPPSLWNRLFGPRPAVPTPQRQWERWAEQGYVPDNTPLPNATKVYQAESIPIAEASYVNPYAPGKGGRRKVRKSRRKV